MIHSKAAIHATITLTGTVAFLVLVVYLIWSLFAWLGPPAIVVIIIGGVVISGLVTAWMDLYDRFKLQYQSEEDKESKPH